MKIDIPFIKITCYTENTYKECVRDKLVDRTATCQNGKVLMLDRWV